MVSLTGASFKLLMNDTTISDTDMESLIDAAISLVNVFSNAELPLMGGTAGSKTVSLDSKQYGVVLIAARAVYNGFYKGVTAPVVDGFTVSTSDIMGNPTVMNTIETASRQLAEMDVGLG